MNLSLFITCITKVPYQPPLENVGQYEQRKVTNGLVLVVKRTNELSELIYQTRKRTLKRDVVSDLLNITLACISLSNSYVDEHQ